MKIDLNYLNRFGSVNLDEDIFINEDYYKNTDIRKLKDIHVNGEIKIDYDDFINLNLQIDGIMVLPCAKTLKDVVYKFNTVIEETIGKFEEIYKNNKNTLEITDILWENIVLEIPIRVVSSDIMPSNTSGDGWELVDENKKEIDPRLAKLTELLDDSGKE